MPANRSASQGRPLAIILGPEGADARLELSRHRHRESWNADLPPADRETTGPHQYAGGLGHHDPLYMRRHQHGGLGHDLRPHRRAAMEPHAGMLAGLTVGTAWAL